MAQHHTPVSVYPQQLDHAQRLWGNFIVISKWSIVGIAIVLALMTLAFIG